MCEQRAKQFRERCQAFFLAELHRTRRKAAQIWITRVERRSVTICDAARSRAGRLDSKTGYFQQKYETALRMEMPKDREGWGHRSVRQTDTNLETVDRWKMLR